MKSATRQSVRWLSSEQAAMHLGYVYTSDVVKNGEVVHRAGDPNVHAFLMWKSRNKPKAYRLSGRLRFRETDLDACLEPVVEERMSRSHLRMVGGARG